jgi:hypothetical protein
MPKRRWRIEWQTQAKSDGLDRLGQMVKLVIDHAAVHGEPEPKSRASPAHAGELDVGRSRDEEMTT